MQMQLCSFRDRKILVRRSLFAFGSKPKRFVADILQAVCVITGMHISMPGVAAIQVIRAEVIPYDSASRVFLQSKC